MRPGLGRRCLGVAAGLVADRALGEPSVEPHPVAAYGSLMSALEARLWAPSRVRGVVYAAAGLGIGAGAGLVGGGSTVGTAAATYLSVGGRALHEAAASIGDALVAGDLAGARATLPALVGRDPSQLDEDEIARAVVESVAENTVDAIVAPAFWALVAGAPGTLAYRAVNTLDAMVGYRNERYERFGWASARLDDAANLVPARLTMLLVMAARPTRAGDVWRLVRRDAGAHPSPNAGVAETAFAAALDLQLGGTNRYGDRVEDRARLGDGRAPVAADIAHVIQLSRDVTTTLAAALALAGAGGTARAGVGALPGARSRRRRA